MKKIISLILTVLFLCVFTFTAYAQGEYRNAMDLYRSWQTGYPDYICGVWSTDGGSRNLTFGITNDEAGERGRQEVLDKIDDDSTVTFVYQKYTLNYLKSIQNEIDSYFDKDVGLLSSCLMEMENYVEIGVDLENPTAGTEIFMQQCLEKYGDAVKFTQGEETYDSVATVGVKKSILPWQICIVIIAMLLFCSLFAYKKTAVLKTASGTNITDDSLSEREIVKMTEQSALTPSAELDKRIFDDIEKI